MRELLEEFAASDDRQDRPVEVRRYGRGEVIAHEGDLADTLHLIRRGRVTAGTTTRYGTEVVYSLMGPGDVFGELALVTADARRTARLMAIEPTETLVIRRGDFDRLRRSRPELQDALTSLLADRIVRLSRQMVEAIAVPAETRVRRRLLDAARFYGDGAPGTVIPLSQDDLAALAGTARATVNRVLGREARRGTLMLGRRRITLLDTGPIERMAR